MYLSLIEEVWDVIDGDKRESRRRYYRLTRQGRALLDMEINRMGAAPEPKAPSVGIRIRRSGEPLGGYIRAARRFIPRTRI